MPIKRSEKREIATRSDSSLTMSRILGLSDCEANVLKVRASCFDKSSLMPVTFCTSEIMEVSGIVRPCNAVKNRFIHDNNF